MSAQEQHDPLGDALERERDAQTSVVAVAPAVVDERSLHARARKAAMLAPTNASLTPLGDELRKWLRTNPVRALQVYEEALSAERTIVVRGEMFSEPDHPTRLRALDAIANRAEGMPTTRTELTGADGGPVTLAALLCIDVNDSI